MLGKRVRRKEKSYYGDSPAPASMNYYFRYATDPSEKAVYHKELGNMVFSS